MTKIAKVLFQKLSILTTRNPAITVPITAIEVPITITLHQVILYSSKKSFFSSFVDKLSTNSDFLGREEGRIRPIV